MSAADRLDDSFPHGTRVGWDRGCKGRCPAGDEHGLSCRKASTLAAGDYRYQKLFRRGLTPAEIADALGLVPDTTAPQQKRVPAASTLPEPEPVPVAVVKVPEVARPQLVEETVAPKVKWAVRRSWVAFAPDGTMHGPFDDHAAAIEFVGEQLRPVQKAAPQRRPMTDEERSEIRRLHGEGLSDGEIGRRLGRTQPVISSWRRRMGLAVNVPFGGAQ
jgi:hypothetical protein